MRFEVLLRPFVSTVAALVRVLKFFNVNDDWRSFSNNEVWHRSGIHEPCSDGINTHRWDWFPVHVSKLLADKLDVESSSTPWAMPKEFHLRDALFQLS